MYTYVVLFSAKYFQVLFDLYFLHQAIVYQTKQLQIIVYFFPYGSVFSRAGLLSSSTKFIASPQTFKTISSIFYCI